MANANATPNEHFNKRSALDPFLKESLNPAQQTAVQITDKNMLVLAGAGSGKTRVITAKIVHLIRSVGVSPREILAITFTNKAAGEMKDRVGEMLEGDEKKYLFIKTFHALGVFLLRYFIEKFPPYTASFAIVDAGEQKALAKKLLPKPAGEASDENSPVKQLLHFISELKMMRLYPGDKGIDAAAAQIMPRPSQRRTEFLLLYRAYTKALEESNRFDFDDLIALPARLIAKDPQVHRYLCSRWRHVLVDEYQDVDMLQEQMVQAFVAGGSMLTVVGDDSQSIYGFRGAKVENILKFQTKVKNSKVVLLEENYRSTSPILELANEVIAHNPVVYQKKLFTRKQEGRRPLLRVFKSDVAEANWVVRNIAKLIRSGATPGDIAVFYRTNSQSRIIEETLVSAKIPYKIIKGRRFYERKEIKTTLSYLQFITNPRDTISLGQILNFPTRGIGAKSQEIIFNYLATVAGEAGVLEALTADELVKKLPKKAAASLVSLVDNFHALNELLLRGEPAGFIVEQTIQRCGVYDFFNAVKDEYERSERLSSLDQLSIAASRHQSEDTQVHPLVDFLRFVLLSGSEETEELEKNVHLITVHNAKGLEYENVHLIGLEDNTFPHFLALQENDVEEERRLLYVGLTRAKLRLFLSAAILKSRFGRIEQLEVSRFLHEMPRRLLDSQSDFDWHDDESGYQISEFF